MLDIPRDRTLSLLARPYQFIDRQCRYRGTDAFGTRILLEKAVCIRGAEAAEMFYTHPALRRRDAAPEPVKATLFGKGAVQQLDGAEHQVRKALFPMVLTPENVARLSRRVRRYWNDFERWAPTRYRLPLYETSQHILALAICEWLGVSVRGRNLARLSADLSSLFHDAAGPGHLKARRSRRRLERWLEGLIKEARRRPQATDSPLLKLVADYVMDTAGGSGSARIAAVELLNVMRPVVAVSVYIVWMAHALLSDPGLRTRLADADTAYRRAFVDEVRRYYPFFPAVMARVSDTFSWHGQQFDEGARVFLDLHGTNRDERHWDNPGQFMPGRFLGEQRHPYAFIPQGGGDVATGHRCPGEPVTVSIMLATLDFLLARVTNDPVPTAKLKIDAHRLPALPAHPIYIACKRGSQRWTVGPK